MKILVNGRFLQPKLEGLGHYTFQIIDHLSLQYPDVEFHVVLDRKFHLPILDRQNVTKHILYPSARHPILWYYWFEIGLPALIKKVKPDVFFSPDGYLSLKSQVPTVMTIHDLAYLHYPKGTLYTHRLFLEKYMSQYVDRADKIICVSKFTKDDVLAQFSNAKNKTSVVHNGVTSEFSPKADSERQAFRKSNSNSQPYFLYLGAIHPRKNVHRLIKAFELYKRKVDNSVCLILAGRLAWSSSEVEQLIASSEFNESIIHLEHNEVDIPSLIGSALAMCYVSLFEGFGLPVLEALSSGVPVITSSNSAMEEVCQASAIYVDPMDISQIAKSMEAISEDSQKTIGLVENGIQQAKKFQWSAAANQIYDVLQLLVKA